ncbi:hypothetical protein DEV91_12551 [Phyllobacterium brassicacearum]|nr:hypothetical protein DEV91_12551 [Phyllobacterium brassicacearum]
MVLVLESYRVFFHPCFDCCRCRTRFHTIRIANRRGNLALFDESCDQRYLLLGCQPGLPSPLRVPPRYSRIMIVLMIVAGRPMPSASIFLMSDAWV